MVQKQLTKYISRDKRVAHSCGQRMNDVGVTPGHHSGGFRGGPGDQDVREHSIQEPPPERVLPDERSSEKMLRRSRMSCRMLWDEQSHPLRNGCATPFCKNFVRYLNSQQLLMANALNRWTEAARFMHLEVALHNIEHLNLIRLRQRYQTQISSLDTKTTGPMSIRSFPLSYLSRSLISAPRAFVRTPRSRNNRPQTLSLQSATTKIPMPPRIKMIWATLTMIINISLLKDFRPHHASKRDLQSRCITDVMPQIAQTLFKLE